MPNTLTALDLAAARISDQDARILSPKLSRCTDLCLDGVQQLGLVAWQKIVDGVAPDIQSFSLSDTSLNGMRQDVQWGKIARGLIKKLGSCNRLSIRGCNQLAMYLSGYKTALPAGMDSLDIGDTIFPSQKPTAWLLSRIKTLRVFRAAGLRKDSLQGSQEPFPSIVRLLSDRIEELDLRRTSLSHADLEVLAPKLRHCRVLLLDGVESVRPEDVRAIYEYLAPDAFCDLIRPVQLQPVVAIPPSAPVRAQPADIEVAAGSPASLGLFLDLLEKAQAGDPYAVYQLAYRYMNGRGVVKDVNEAKRWYSKLTDEGIERIAREHPGLTELDLSSCEQLTDAAIATLVKAYPNLSKLTLKGCTGLTCAAFEALASGCTDLQHIDLSGTSLDDASVTSLMKLVSRAKGVKLADCPQISPAGWAKVIEALPSDLEALDLTGVPLTDSEAERLAPKLARCTDLSLGGCADLTAKGWSLLYSGINPSIKRLHISGAYLKGADEVERLLPKLGECSDLSLANANTVFPLLRRIIERLPAEVRALDVSGLSLRGLLNSLQARLRDASVFKARGCRLADTEEWSSLIRVMPDNVEELDLSDTSVKSSDIPALAAKVRFCRSLQLASVISLQPDDLDSLREALPIGAVFAVGKGIETINKGVQQAPLPPPSPASASPQGPLGADPISARVLADQFSGLTELDLSGFDFGDSAVPVLLQVLPHCTVVKLGACPRVSVDQWPGIVAALSLAINSFALTDVNLTDGVSEQLAGKLYQCTDLNLDRCKLSSAGWTTIAGALPQNVRALSIAGAPLKYKPFRILLKAKLTRCESLSLANCESSPATLMQLFSSLTTSLTSIDISGLRLGNALPQLKKLLSRCTVFRARACQDAGTQSLLEALPSNVVDIDLSGSDLNGPALKSLMTKLGSCRRICLSGVSVSASDLTGIRKALPPGAVLEE